MTDETDKNWKSKAAVAAGAAVGSAAIAAALLWVKNRNDKAKGGKPPAIPKLPPETD